MVKGLRELPLRFLFERRLEVLQIGQVVDRLLSSGYADTDAEMVTHHFLEDCYSF